LLHCVMNVSQDEKEHKHEKTFRLL
jgi:hypothetical protein